MSLCARCYHYTITASFMINKTKLIYHRIIKTFGQFHLTRRNVKKKKNHSSLNGHYMKKFKTISHFKDMLTSDYFCKLHFLENYIHHC